MTPVHTRPTASATTAHTHTGHTGNTGNTGNTGRTTRTRTRTRTTVLVLLLLTGCAARQSPGPDAVPAPRATVQTPRPAATATSAAPPPAAPLPRRTAHGSPSAAPPPSATDGENPDTLGEKAITLLSSHDTTTDTSRNDAALRAADAGWTTSRFAAQTREAVSRSAPGPQWQLWSTHRAYTRATLDPADEAGRPHDTPLTAYRQWTVTLTPIGRDGWRGTPETHTAYAELTRPTETGPWRLNTVTLR